MKTIALRRALAAAASTAVIATCAAASEDRVRIEMPAQPLGQAVAAFSEQADVPVIAPAALLSGRQANALSGEFTVASALSAMLAGSAVEARADASGAYVLAAAPAALVVEDEEDDEARAEVDDVVVVKGFRSSFNSSLATKRNAQQVLDAITAEEIGLFSDQNITEAVQRISGVQITRNNGEGESVTIRGLSPAFTRVELDGRTTSITVDSANPERQSVLSVFSSDLYNSIEIIKSPTAADVEGGIGGIVRLKTPNPLEVGELRFGLEGTLTDAEYRDEEEPGVNGFYINTFMDNRLGLLVSGTYESKDRRFDRIENTNGFRTVDTGYLADDTDPALLALVGADYARQTRQELRAGDIDRYNYNIKFQYAATESLTLFADVYGAKEERVEDRSRIQVDWTRGELVGGVAEDGLLTVAEVDRQRVDLNTFSRFVDITSLGYTFAAEFENAGWKARAEVNQASSEEAFTEYRAQARVNRDGVGGYDITVDPEAPAFATPSSEADLADIDVRNLDLQKRVISIDETVGRFDAERFVSFGPFTSFETGVRYAGAEFGRLQGAVQSDASLTLDDGVDGFVLDGRTFGFGEGGAGVLTSWPSVDPELFYLENPSPDAFAFNDENLWTIKENTYAAYVLANYEATGAAYLRGNLGVRFVFTEYEGSGVEDVAVDGGTDFGNIGDRRTLDADYTDVLPSFNFTLSASDASPLIVRGAVTRALTRPDINQINPGLVVRLDDVENDGDPGTFEGTFEEGNPDLKPYEAWQYDIGAEFYFGAEDAGLLSIAYFYKDVQNFITVQQQTRLYARPELGIGTLGALDIEVEDFPVNGGEATVQGFEIGLQTPFSFLPAPFDGFGIFANYTYTDSEFTTDDGLTFPFPGASEDAYNIVGYFEKGGFSTRLAYNYRGEFLDEFNGGATNNEYTDEQGRLDLAVRYRFENGLRFSFDALNLTESFNYDYWDETNRLRRREFESRIYTFSVAYTF